MDLRDFGLSCIMLGHHIVNFKLKFLKNCIKQLKINLWPFPDVVIDINKYFWVTQESSYECFLMLYPVVYKFWRTLEINVNFIAFTKTY